MMRTTPHPTSNHTAGEMVGFFDRSGTTARRRAGHEASVRHFSVLEFMRRARERAFCGGILLFSTGSGVTADTASALHLAATITQALEAVPLMLSDLE